VITDTHAHLFWQSYDADRRAVLERAFAAGVERIVIVGTDVATSRAAFELCERESASMAREGRVASSEVASHASELATNSGRDASSRQVLASSDEQRSPRDGQRSHASSAPSEQRTPSLYPTAGIHPHDAATTDDAMRAEIRALCSREDCVAVGETGLDYFKNFSPREEQRANFRWHIELAAELDKPLIVHCRDAHDETVELLRSVPGVRGVMHCYTMGEAELAPYLELGFYISFSGVVTYPKNDANRGAASVVPIDRLLFETDCPFLAPQGERGKRNEPAYVKRVLEDVAMLRGADEREIAERSSRNAERLFGLPAL
jgi:TatD DNase family protein